jgi:acyl-CoA synthetase (AMP-forming)/AMP-acid ligase II
VKIVDPETRLEMPDGAVGEIWATGPSIARGYWNLESRTAEVFGQRLTGDERDWLRTGDLGCLYDGQLYVTGRIKDVLIIRGQNYSPSDIERAVQESHTALTRNGGAAFCVEVEDEEKLIIV